MHWQAAQRATIALIVLLLPVTTSGCASGSPISATAVPVTTFVPASLAASDSEHLVLVGATGDATGTGVVARSTDGGTHWSYAHLNEPALDYVTASGRTVWATTVCANPTVTPCEDHVLASADDGATWRRVAGGLWLYHPTLDGAQVRALTPLDLSGPATLNLSVDGGATWMQTTAPCRRGAWGALAVESIGAQAWAACVGDTSLGQEVKEILYSADGGSSWQVQASNAVGAGQAAPIGDVPLSGQLFGISVRPDGHGWLWTDRALWETADGGRTWTPLAFVAPNGDRYVVAAALLDDRSGFALVRDSRASAVEVERTSDGGRSWHPVASWPLPQTTAPPTLSPNCPPETPLPLGPDAQQAALAAVEASIPTIYNNIDPRGHRITDAWPAAARPNDPLSRIPGSLCGQLVGERTYIVRLLFPAMLPSADLSQGQDFVADFSSGWRVWFVYH